MAADQSDQKTKKSWLKFWQRDAATSTDATDVQSENTDSHAVDSAENTAANPVIESSEQETAPSVWQRLKSGLAKTRGRLSSITNTLLGRQGPLDDETREELETALLQADVGFETTEHLLEALDQRLRASADLEANDALEACLVDSLNQYQPENYAGFDVEEIRRVNASGEPYVITMIGVNGAGKTTTIAKLAKWLQAHDLSVMLAAGDTFRAAAVEQLKVWGERESVHVVAQETGSDSAAVIFDALQSAKAKSVDVVLVDTAGRLHNHGPLMDELAKIRRVMKKCLNNAPHKSCLVLDATIGQNALKQAQVFGEAFQVDGFILTKLDSSAKGGVIFALTNACQKPVYFIGVGERADDLQTFSANAFVKALLETA